MIKHIFGSICVAVVFGFSLPVFSQSYTDTVRKNPYVSSKYKAIQAQLAKKATSKNQYIAPRAQQKRGDIPTYDSASKHSVQNSRMYKDFKKPTIQPMHIFSLLPKLVYLQFRHIDASNNHPDRLGMSDTFFSRLTPVAYSDGKDTLAGASRKNPREISNIVFAQQGLVPNRNGFSSFLWQWGQFIDHDLTHTHTHTPAEYAHISIPYGDRWFDPYNTGNIVMPFSRSAYAYLQGKREQINTITTFLDGSMVYGSSDKEAARLRQRNGLGKMKIGYAENGESILPDSGREFIAGDTRSSEQPGLTAMHTLFVREHNYWADRIKKAYPKLSGNEIYALARDIVTAEIQSITYREYLPLILGKRAISAYAGYNSSLKPTIYNEFSTAAFRFGHTQLTPELLRIDSKGIESSEGHLSLARSFFDISHVKKYGVDSVVRGLHHNLAQKVDTKVIDSVRNMLFGAPGAGGFDLVALNIQRGRDHGLASYNVTRKCLGLQPKYAFDEITSDRSVADSLEKAYKDTTDIDLWVGGLAEKPYKGGVVGETFHTIIKKQFELLRDADAFWYEHRYPDIFVDFIHRQTLREIVLRNTSITDRELGKNLFYVQR